MYFLILTLYDSLGQNKKQKNFIMNANQDLHNLKQTRKFLMTGQLTMIGDGLYEKERCSSCNEQHRIASVLTEAYRTPKHCTLPSILSRCPPSPVTAKKEKTNSNRTTPTPTDFHIDVSKTAPFSREFCRKMLCQEENTLTERLQFEKALLEETEK